MANSVKRKLSVTNLSLKNNLLTFRVNVPVIIRVYRVSSPTAPGSPIQWSPHSESGGGSPRYTPLQPTSPSSSLSGMLLFTPDVFTHLSHIGYHLQWSLFLLLSLVWAAHVGCFLFRWGRIVADKFHRVISYFRYLEY